MKMSGIDHQTEVNKDNFEKSVEANEKGLGVGVSLTVDVKGIVKVERCHAKKHVDKTNKSERKDVEEKWLDPLSET